MGSRTCAKKPSRLPRIARRLSAPIFVAASFFFAAPFCRAAGKAGVSSADFLRLGTGARYLAMGEAATAVVNDVNALFWNPANLSLIRQNSISLMHAVHVENIQYQFAGYAERVGHWGTFGGAVQTLSAGTLAETDDTGREVGTLLPRDFAGSVGWGLPLGKYFSFGLSGKFIQSRIIHTASTFAGDAGWGFHAARWAMAAAIRNVGGKLKFDQEKESLPSTAQAGLSFLLTRHWIWSVDGIFPNDASAVLGTGIEYAIPYGKGSAVFFRAGYNTRLKDVPGFQGFSAGLGWRWSLIDLDYAWSAFGDLGQTHRVSVTLRFGRSESVRPKRGRY